MALKQNGSDAPQLTHLNPDGRARMVDVTDKARSRREATATVTVRLNAATFDLLSRGAVKKGDVLAVAQLAGIMAAKKTPDWIPLCHPIGLTGCDLTFRLDDERHTITIEATTVCTGETGVEMEALCAASAAALTIYDMCKAVQRDIIIDGLRLLHKSGGRSGEFRAEEHYDGD